MKIVSGLFILLAYVILLDARTQNANNLNPYNILKINKLATRQKLQKQYTRMRSRYRNNRGKKRMIRNAYQQILFQRQYNTNYQPIIPEQQNQFLITDQIDQKYVYGYKLNSEFDNGKYFYKHFNATDFLQLKIKTSESNKKIANIVIILGGFLIKIIPCILLIFCCRNRMTDNHDGMHQFKAHSSRKIGQRLL